MAQTTYQTEKFARNNRNVDLIRENFQEFPIVLEKQDRAAVLYRHREEITCLKEMKFVHGCDDDYRLTAECCGEEAVFYVDGAELFRLSTL